jgi:shikimate dehydrogenase
VIPYLDEMDDNAKQIGAVNTIVNTNGKLVGHNTDFSGFLYMIQNNKVEIRDKKVLVLGNGGASKAVVAVLTFLKAKEIILVSRTIRDNTIAYEECYKNHSDGQVIVNATPVGMYPNIDGSPIDLNKFTQCEAVLDLIYNPLQTKLLIQADELGMKAVNGLEMLVAQAKFAVEYFIGNKIDDMKIKEVTNEVYNEILNR